MPRWFVFGLLFTASALVQASCGSGADDGSGAFADVARAADAGADAPVAPPADALTGDLLAGDTHSADAATDDDTPTSASDAEVVAPPPPDGGDSDGAGADVTARDVPGDTASADACAPSCGDRVCGPDGCGGVCGDCSTAQQRCVAGQCEAPRIVFNELVATNDNGIDDEDGDHSDWLELYNREDAAVSLDGWFLTDDRETLAKWRLPAVSLGAHQFLLVFASGKDRAPADGELHTDFRLTSDGEYLALVLPDGVTVVDALAPAFPPQYPDVSYGVAQEVAATELVARGATARFLVPTDGALGTTWTAPDFDDRGWDEGPTGIGFERAGAPFPLDAPNLAEGRDTTQTSVEGEYGSGRAIDGDDQSFTHTLPEDAAPAWEVDLGATVWLSAVELHNRLDCCMSRLRDVTVRVLDADGAEVYTSDAVNPGNERFGRELGEGPIRWDIDLYGRGGVLGRTVRVTRTPDPELYGTRGGGGADEVSVLSLAEVVVRGGESGLFTEVATDVGDRMVGQATSLYTRIPFTLDEPEGIQVLTLVVHHDAGYVAWLNGERIAAGNAPDEPSWDSVATDEHAGGLVADTVDVTPYRPLLRAGRNVLAIQGLNGAADDTDFVVLPELVARRVRDGAVAWFPDPTPGAVNETPSFEGYAAPPVADPPHGFYDAPFALTLTSATPNATLYYTLDATPPSPTNGTVYEAPIAVDRTTVVRAVAVREGFAPAPPTTATYLFLDDVIAQDRAATEAMGFPASWGETGADYGMDPRVVAQDGSDAYGGRYAATVRGDLQSLPTLSLVLPADELFGPDGIYTHSTQRGVEWERAASLELVYPPGWTEGFPEDWAGDPQGLQLACGVRVQGGAFRRHDLTKKHSLRVLFKTRYGPTKLRYPLFGDGATDRFDTLTLRANSNDGWQWGGANAKPTYIRDAFGRRTALDMGAVASHAAFFHLYVDGVYWGVYEAVERPDHTFSATYFGGEKDDWDSVSNGAASNGDLDAWNTLLDMARDGLAADDDYLRAQGLASDGTPDDTLPAYVDVDNLIDYMIVNLYVGNTDWPHHNYWVGRPRDGRSGFKFYMWDSEWSLGLRSDLSTNQIGVDRGVAVPWWSIKDNGEFQLRFADRVQRVFFHDGPLYVDPAAPHWDPAHPERNRPAARFAALSAQIERALVAESARWGDQHASAPYTVDEHWRVEVEALLRDYFPQRSARVIQQFRDAGLYPATPPPDIQPFGGPVAPGAAITLEATAGVVHYTLDGGDPRVFGGGVAPGALGGTTTVSLGAPATAGPLLVRARTLSNGAWSALEEATFAVQP